MASAAPVRAGAEKPVTKWFRNEVFPWRLYDSIFRSCLLHFAVLYACLAANHLASHPLSPLRALSGPFRVLLWPSSWFYDLLIGACQAAFLVLLGRRLSPRPLVPLSRASSLSLLLTAPSLTLMASLALLCAVTVRSYLGLWGGPFNAMSVPCIEESSSMCLNEEHFFLVFSGLTSGVLFGYRLICSNAGLLTFPQINLSGSGQFRQRFFDMLIESSRMSLSTLKWHTAGYVVFGRRVVLTIAAITRRQVDTESWDSWATTVWTTAHVLLACFALNAVLALALRGAAEILAITSVKPLNLPPTGEKGLVAAMEQDDDDVLRHLAFGEFERLSDGDKTTRQFAFELSNPGGHPRNWNRICDVCVKVIEDFISSLQASSQTKPIVTANLMATSTPTAASSENSSQHPHLRLRHQQFKAQQPAVPPGGSGNPSKSSIAWPAPVASLWSKLSRNSLFAQFPEAATRAVFAKAQLVIWAVEGLSHLIALSIFEDQYGVVQRRLGNILAVMISLQKTVERHKGLTVNIRRNSSEVRDLQLKQELRAAVKTSLYRVIAAFGDHISAVQMPHDLKLKIESYKAFMEA